MENKWTVTIGDTGSVRADEHAVEEAALFPAFRTVADRLERRAAWWHVLYPRAT